jgi:hypothetical protein
MKIKAILFATALFIALLAGIHGIHFACLDVDVVFYAAVGDAVMATLIAAFLLFSLRSFNALGRTEKSLLAVIWLLAGYCFAISVPTVIDRSLSFYLLEKIQQRGGGILQKKMPEVFIHEYLPEHRLVDVRLTEQLESGTISIRNGCVRLTAKGALIARLSRFYRTHFLPRKRLLMGKYTDDLTDPFRNSVPETDYTCGQGQE